MHLQLLLTACVFALALAKSRRERAEIKASAAAKAGDHITIPYNNPKEHPLYIAATDNGEACITATPGDRDHAPGQRLTVNDYITSVNGKPVFNGNIEDLLLSSDSNEVVIPVVDHEDIKGAGSKLLGFVSMKVLNPKYLMIKREGGTSDGNVSEGSSGDSAAIHSEERVDVSGSVRREAMRVETIGMTNNKNNNDNNIAKNTDSNSDGEGASDGKPAKKKKARARAKGGKRKPSPGVPQQTERLAAANGSGSRDRSEEEMEGAPAEQAEQAEQEQQGEEEQGGEEQRQAPTLANMYGPGRPYPEPYSAGQVPAQTVHERFSARSRHQPFTYSVRFRSGPFGFSFDNRRQGGTFVEKVVNNGQAHNSDIQLGDQLVAVDVYNTTTAPAVVSQKLLNSLPWPRVLVFQHAGGGDDRQLAQEEQSRTFNLTVLYPPTVTGSFQVRVASWTPAIQTSLEDPLSCPLYVLRTPADLFGCDAAAEAVEGAALAEGLLRLVESRAEAEQAEQWPMLTMLLEQLRLQNMRAELLPATIAKRGVCTFVKKALVAAAGSSRLVLVVNNDDSLHDMLAGKEDTAGCSAAAGAVREADGLLLHMAAMSRDVLAVASGPEGTSAACAATARAAEDLLDQWAHSVPPVAAEQVLAYSPPGKDQLRGVQHEGGRLAVSGENGWAFFDYHLAMFGPQEVPLGAHRLVFAKPAYGCDPAAYAVRIQGAVVAILRGGGCSFGIKVLNAQKLGARAVVIVNTDDVATMRLMAQPDEAPLIKIPTIMVSRRLQHYMESLLKYYYLIDQHFISVQPTGLFHEYEKRNRVELPMRLDTLVKM